MFSNGLNKQNSFCKIVNMSSDSDSDGDFTKSKSTVSLQQQFFKKFKSEKPDTKILSSDSENEKDLNSNKPPVKLPTARRKRKVSTPTPTAEDSFSLPASNADRTSPITILSDVESESVQPAPRRPVRVTRSSARRKTSARNPQPESIPSTSQNTGRTIKNRRRAKKDVHDMSTDDECKENIYRHIPVIVKVLWRSNELKKFSVKRFTKLSLISDYFAKTYQVDPRLLFFTLNDNEIDLNSSTYITLRLGVSDQIEGGVLPDTFLNQRNVVQEDKTGLKVKVQYEERKAFYMYLKPDDQLEMIFSRTATNLNLPYEKIRVLYDGESVKQSSTVNNLGIEDGDVFDIVIDCIIGFPL